MQPSALRSGTHKSVNMKLRIAAAFSDIIFTASKESFRLKSSKSASWGTVLIRNSFPDTNVARGDWMISVVPAHEKQAA